VGKGLQNFLDRIGHLRVSLYAGSISRLVSLRQHHYAGQNIAGTRAAAFLWQRTPPTLPTRDITFYVPYAPAAPPIRSIADMPSSRKSNSGSGVIVENKPGASARHGRRHPVEFGPKISQTVKVRPSPLVERREKNKPYGNTSRRSLSCYPSRPLSVQQSRLRRLDYRDSSWASLSPRHRHVIGAARRRSFTSASPIGGLRRSWGG